MKVAIATDGPGVTAPVSRRFGTARYFLIGDVEGETLAAIENPGLKTPRGAGVLAVVLLLNRDVDVLLTGYCSPAMQQQLEDNGVRVLSGLHGVARDVLHQYRRGDKGAETVPRSLQSLISRERLLEAGQRTMKQFLAMLPMMVGVVLLVGLLTRVVSTRWIPSVFSGGFALDTFWGACIGSILAGNPINSYIIGNGLLQQGVNLVAVTVFMLCWTTVGLVQLPAESAALGRRFALQRNVFCFLLAFPTAMATVWIVSLMSGGAP